MAVKEIFRFSCDAPGCDQKIEIEAEQREQVEVPDGWYDEQVEDTHLIGCCEAHICAAIVKELGYEKVAEAMMSLKIPEKAGAAATVPASPTPPPTPPPADPQSKVATLPIAPPKKDPTGDFQP
jgi:hypothetical protein